MVLLLVGWMFALTFQPVESSLEELLRIIPVELESTSSSHQRLSFCSSQIVSAVSCHRVFVLSLCLPTPPSLSLSTHFVDHCALNSILVGLDILY